MFERLCDSKDNTDDGPVSPATGATPTLCMCAGLTTPSHLCHDTRLCPMSMLVVLAQLSHTLLENCAITLQFLRESRPRELVSATIGKD